MARAFMMPISVAMSFAFSEVIPIFFTATFLSFRVSVASKTSPAALRGGGQPFSREETRDTVRAGARAGSPLPNLDEVSEELGRVLLARELAQRDGGDFLGQRGGNLDALARSLLHGL
jgi:hypothetical protein